MSIQNDRKDRMKRVGGKLYNANFRIRIKFWYVENSIDTVDAVQKKRNGQMKQGAKNDATTILAYI